MMSLKRSLIFFFLVCTGQWLCAQTDPDFTSESIADCEGAMSLTESGNYSIQFTGGPGNNKELNLFPDLIDISDNNLVWITFLAENTGVVTFNADIQKDFLQMVIFEDNGNNVCPNLYKGNAKVYRNHTSIDLMNIGLSEQIREGYYYPIELAAGQRIMIAFSTAEKSKAIMNLQFHFKEKDETVRLANISKTIDLLNSPRLPSVQVKIRDAETGEPIVADLLIEGAKELAALYKCSDLNMNVTRACKVMVNCDAEGYFFLDKEISIDFVRNQEILLKLDPIRKGKSMQIQEIEFKPGTSNFMTGAEPKLKRLKDFLALNASIEIEIQGHVFALGENKMQHQRMSEDRAKKVMNYLIENGIAKERMSAVGYGNTRPIYPNAKLAYEEQANRRVEILVK